MASHVIDRDHGKIKRGTLYAKPRTQIRFGFFLDEKLNQKSKNFKFKVTLNLVGKYDKINSCINHQQSLKELGMQEYAKIEHDSFFYIKDHEVHHHLTF